MLLKTFVTSGFVCSEDLYSRGFIFNQILIREVYPEGQGSKLRIFYFFLDLALDFSSPSQITRQKFNLFHRF